MDPYIGAFFSDHIGNSAVVKCDNIFYNILVEFRLVVEIVQKQDSNDLP